ncbi:hypothetical protein RchiOBHm_Chr4g0404801 [Rosa chinensis]|uniref:Uncharacterized protein n=1 Tax=Rosa chinensis TaxID=74649 RepID=A0A2P6QTX3_ROSCH|nr:hypothetical protein RchiOBHm_Chr4g0404801 [Rosa chinensis]
MKVTQKCIAELLSGMRESSSAYYNITRKLNYFVFTLVLLNKNLRAYYNVRHAYNTLKPNLP